MPSICYGFVQNAWRQDICSNCFRLKEEHTQNQPQNHQNQLKKPFLTSKNYDFELKNQAGRYQSPVLNAYSSTSISSISSSGIPRVNTAINKYTNRPKNSFLYSNYETKMSNSPSSSSNNTNISNTSSSSSSSSTSCTSKMALNATERLERAVGGCGVEKIENLKSLPNPVSSNSNCSRGTKNNSNYQNNHQKQNQNHNQFVNSNKNCLVNNTISSTTTSNDNTKGILQNPKKNDKKSVQFVVEKRDDFVQKVPQIQIQKQVLVTSANCTPNISTSTRHNSSISTSQMATNIQVDHNDLVVVIKNEPKKSVKVATSGPCKKGILTKKDNPGNKGRRKFSVNFPQEVCEVICDEEDGLDVGDGDGEWVSDDESDDEDPNDTKSIPELLELGSTNDYERELNKITVKNTSFNSIKNNLLGYAPIEIGLGITGNTGGKSKPLISIGTFEARAEPPRKSTQKSQNTIKNDQNSSKNDTNLQKIDQKTVKIDTIVTKTEKISSKIDQNLPNKVVPQSNHEKSLVLTAEKSRISDVKDLKENNNNLVIKSNVNSNDKSDIQNLKGNLKDIKSGNEAPKILTTSSKTDLKDLKSDTKIKSDELTTTTTNSATNNSTGNSSSINNLFILNDGQIANKRTSFLHEIINKNNQQTDMNLSSITNNDLDSLEISTSASKSRILKQTQINNDQNHLNFRGIGEFDDSLELDSGLEDMKKTREPGKFEKFEKNGEIESSNGSSGSSGTSGSSDNDQEEQEPDDEKCSSDSGNENDFSERERIRNLYISVEENVKIEGEPKPKLSPDSLLFSNGSSGSSESLTGGNEGLSLPEKSENLQVKRPSIKGNAPLPPLVKRLAPAPPPANENKENLSKIPLELDEIDTVAHVNQGKIEEIIEPECDYDDVENLKCEIEDFIRSKISIESNPSEDHDLDDEEEVIYDDCMAIKGQSVHLDPNGKSTTGSYDFTGGSILDTDSSEKLPDRQNNGGIEFIGIRKIDAESLLNPQGSMMANRTRSPSPFSKSRDDLQNIRKEKERSTGSPKARRKVNQFFSTIGKKAGAAFAASRDANLFGQSSSSGQSNKSSMSNGLDFRSSNSREGITGYRRSMSQDEVSMTRTQEIYATLTPTSMKLRGLAPVLHKLSKLDKDNQKDKDLDQNKEKIFKKNKLSTSIKKFLRFNNNSDKEYLPPQDYPQSQSQSQWHTTTNTEEIDNKKPNFGKKTESVDDLYTGQNSGEIRRTSSASLVSAGTSVSYDTRSNFSNSQNQNQNQQNQNHQNQNHNQNVMKKPKILPKPPPLPQRIHSLENNDKNKNDNKNGSYCKPARPPPPVRSNRVAPTPQFVSVFDRSNSTTTNGNSQNSNSSSPPSTISRQGHSIGSSRLKNSFLDDKKTYAITAGELAKAMGGGPVPLQINLNLKNHQNQNQNQNNYFADYDEDSSSSSLTPPNKPKRKASMNSHKNSNGDTIDSHNSHQISNLNYETLKMIASQAPAKIDGSDGFKSITSDCDSFRWSHFTIDDRRPLASGHKYAFFEARWTGNQNDFHTNESLILLLEENSPGTGIKKSESHFLANYTEILSTFEDSVPSEFIPWEASAYLNSSHNVKVSITLVPLCHIQKITDYITNPAITLEKKYFALLQSMLHWSKEPDFNELLVLQNLNNSDDSDYNSILYIIQYPGGNCTSKRTSFSSEWSPFEISIKQILITQLLSSRGNEHDREILLRRISGSCEEVQAQLRLFCQLKLFGPKSEDLMRIRKYRSERATKEWINKEIAISMKEAVQRTIQRHNLAITPLKKAYVEFLMMAEISVKNVLDFLIDLV